jgi:hypothetical protein
VLSEAVAVQHRRPPLSGSCFQLFKRAPQTFHFIHDPSLDKRSCVLVTHEVVAINHEATAFIRTADAVIHIEIHVAHDDMTVTHVDEVVIRKSGARLASVSRGKNQARSGRSDLGVFDEIGIVYDASGAVDEDDVTVYDDDWVALGESRTVNERSNTASRPETVLGDEWTAGSEREQARS